MHASAATEIDQKASTSLTRTVKLRLYPSNEQAAQINRTIGTIRYCWNTLWLPMLREATRKRGEHAERSSGTKEAWKEAWQLYPDPTETQYNRARIAATHTDSTAWIGEALKTPLTRASRNFSLAVRASRGYTMSGAPRKIRAGHVRPRSRRDDTREGLEWQLSGKALSCVANPLQGIVNIPTLGSIGFADKATLLRSYIAAGAEACELTVKRDGAHYYACIAVRGLQLLVEHPNAGTAIGLDMGVVNPISMSDGRHLTEHQGHRIAAHMATLERKKLRVSRQRARKLYAAAERAGAITATGAFKKGVRIAHSNHMRRLDARLNKIDRQIVGYRADWQRCQALKIVRASEIIVVEALTIKNMTASAAGTIERPGRNVRAKFGLNRAILSRGWGLMRQRLKTKAEEFHGQVIEVDPAYTSQTCPECGMVDKDNRKTQAQFACMGCGHKEHADTIGAKNILARGLSAGAPPAAGRGGYATVAMPQGVAGERAAETSNKSPREPHGSSPRSSRGAKPHNPKRLSKRQGTIDRADGEPGEPAAPIHRLARPWGW